MVAIERQKQVGVPVVDGILEAGAAALRRVSGRPNAWWLEQLLNQGEYRGFVFRSGGSNADG
jgi:hypothetical protein